MNREKHPLLNLSILWVFALAPFWLKWPAAPAPLTTLYPLGYVQASPMIAALALWILHGAPGWSRFRASRIRLIWLGLLLAYVVWTILSISWAYGSEAHPGLATAAALQAALVGAFALVVACHPPRGLLPVLIGSLLFHGTVGALQVAVQGSVGLGWLGEFPLDPAQSGVSVIQSGDVRWLRAYGLLPHPNVLAGFLVLGLYAAAAWLLRDGWRYVVGVGAWLAGLWFLMLTFSRGAWLGFATGLLVALPLLRHDLAKIRWRRRLLPVAALSVLLGLSFVGLYQPLLLARAGVGQENTEMRSIADRVVYNRIAREAIREHPVRGVGAGNYPWYSAVYLFERTEYDLRGTDVHNVYLGVAADLGFVGITLYGGFLLIGSLAVLRNQPDAAQVAAFAGFIAWATIGIFDHYPQTQIYTSAVWFGLLAYALSPSNDESQAITETTIPEAPHNPPL